MVRYLHKVMSVMFSEDIKIIDLANEYGLPELLVIANVTNYFGTVQSNSIILNHCKK